MMKTTREQLLERIVLDPRILVGKPVVRGTHIPVYLVLNHLAHNLDLNDLFAAYPGLTIEDVQACLAYAQGVVAGEDVFPVFITEAEAASPTWSFSSTRAPISGLRHFCTSVRTM